MSVLHRTIAALGLTCAAAPAAEAAIVYAKSFTGAEMVAAGTVEPTAVATPEGPTGYRLTQTADWGRLLQLPLLGADPARANSRMTVHLSFSYDMWTGDNDLNFGLSDGARVFGFVRNDSGNVGTFGADASASLTPFTLQNFSRLVSYSGPYERRPAETVHLTYELRGSETPGAFYAPVSAARYLEGDHLADTAMIGSPDLDVAGPLSFVLYANHKQEQYTLQSLQVIIEEEPWMEVDPGVASLLVTEAATDGAGAGVISLAAAGPSGPVIPNPLPGGLALMLAPLGLMALRARKG